MEGRNRDLSTKSDGSRLEFGRELISFPFRGPSLQQDVQNEGCHVPVVREGKTTTVE